MKRYILSLLTGTMLSALLFGGGTALASTGVMATPSSQTIYVDGQRVSMTAFSIGGNNYVKLRDVGKAVNFAVAYDALTNSVRIDSGAPYTEEVKATPPAATVTTPAPAPVGTPATATTGQSYTISTDHWSREDFSRQANPAVFTGIYDRALYNTLRQAVVDAGTDNSSGGKNAYTMVTPGNYGTVKRLVGRMDGVMRYEHRVPDNFLNYYEYPNYFAVTPETPENHAAPLAYVQPVIAEAKRLTTDREKVQYLNNYLCECLDYKAGTTAGVARIFSDHDAGLTGACGSYAVALSFLCDAADIPCITVSSSNHTWNLVYADGAWGHVDASSNDCGWDILLAKTHPHSTDAAPQATAFLQEVLVPGSTK